MHENEIAHRLGSVEAKIDLLLEQTRTFQRALDANGRDINIARGMGMLAVFLSGLSVLWDRLFSS